MSRQEDSKATDRVTDDNSLTITFYSTSPPDERKSKYPKTNKTSYRIPEPKDNAVMNTVVRTTFGFDTSGQTATANQSGQKRTKKSPVLREENQEGEENQATTQSTTPQATVPQVTVPQATKPQATKPQATSKDTLQTVTAETEEPVIRTRSGRTTKAPVRYEPKERVLDDFDDDDDEYDSDESFV